jgi:putative ABC transport system substrate-binding protein
LRLLALSLATRVLGLMNASTDAEIEAAFAGFPQQPGLALISSLNAFPYSRRARLAELTASHAMPAIFDVWDYVDAGGLVSYCADFFSVMQLASSCGGRVLKGEKPADPPVVQPQEFELVINLKAAKSLGLGCRRRCSPPPTTWWSRRSVQ